MKCNMQGAKYKNGNSMTLLAMYGNVEFEKAIDSILYRTNENVLDIKKINESANNGVIYFNIKGLTVDTQDEKDSEVKFKVIPLGYLDKKSNCELCGSFMKDALGWQGIYVGDLYGLVTGIQLIYTKNGGTITDEELSEKYSFNSDFKINGCGAAECFNNNGLVYGDNEYIIQESKGTSEYAQDDNISKLDNKQDIYEVIYDRLLIKENWKKTEKNRLRGYIKALMEKVAYEQRNNKSNVGNGYIISKDREKCVINTGLIDKFNNDIFILDSSNRNTDFASKDIDIMPPKYWLVDHKFNRDDLRSMPKPIKFYENKEELIFNGSIEDIDIEDDYRLSHIIEERNFRFPTEFQDMAKDMLCDKLKSAIHKAVRLSERDYKYIIPMYNLKLNKIQFLMPLHLNKSIEDTPDIVAVLGEDNGFYYLYTILETDDAYDNARLLCRPDSNWLRV